MSHPRLDRVSDILGPFHDRIRKVVEAAWSEWRSVAEFRAEQRMSPLLYSRTVANYVFDAIARLAVAEFAGDASVHLKIESQTIKFYFTAGVLARFKKGGDNNLGRNIPTQSALAFADPECLFADLPPETAKVEFIWTANDIQTELENVLVVARDGERLLWSYEIEPRDGTLVIPFPPSPTPGLPPDGDEDLIRPRIAPEQDTKKR